MLRSPVPPAQLISQDSEAMDHRFDKFRFLLIALCVAVPMGAAEAQIIPGDTPSSGIGAAVLNSRSRPLLGLSKGGANSEYVYQSRSPSDNRNRKPASDPWATIRQPTPAPSHDRHRAY